MLFCHSHCALQCSDRVTGATVQSCAALGKRRPTMEHLERKLASLSAVNSALRAENEELRQRLEEFEDEKDSDNEQELSEMQAEFAERIARFDKQLAAAKV